MKNLVSSKIRVVKKSTKREPVTMRIGARVSTITYPEDPKKKGVTTHQSNYSVHELRETSSVMQEEDNMIKYQKEHNG